MDVQQYEALIEKLELLQDIRSAEKQILTDKGITHESVKKQILKQVISAIKKVPLC